MLRTAVTGNYYDENYTNNNSNYTSFDDFGVVDMKTKLFSVFIKKFAYQKSGFIAPG